MKLTTDMASLAPMVLGGYRRSDIARALTDAEVAPGERHTILGLLESAGPAVHGWLSDPFADRPTSGERHDETQLRRFSAGRMTAEQMDNVLKSLQYRQNVAVFFGTGALLMAAGALAVFF